MNSLTDKLNQVLVALKDLKISEWIEFFSNKLDDFISHPDFNPLIAKYFQNINRTGQPFTNFDDDPDNVSQIKKLMNAFYYGQLAAKEIEQRPPFSGTVNVAQEAYTLFYSNSSQLVDNIYDAFFLASHLDVNLYEIFEDEFAVLAEKVQKAQGLIIKNQESIKQLSETASKYPFDYKAGEIAGTAISQLQPMEEVHDYKFLTEFGAVLPRYIEKLTEGIKYYSAQLIEEEPTLKTDQIAELKKQSLELLADIENYNFSTFKTTQYLFILKKIWHLAKTSLDQMTYFSESSQDWIRDNIAEIKYIHMSQLFSLVDTLEVNLMLKPGTLSKRLMEKLKTLYDTLIFYAKKPVDFELKGEELLSIEDSRFLALRLENTYRRIDKAKIALFDIQKAHEACECFFKILHANPSFQTIELHQLPEDIRQQLASHYMLMKPYVLKKYPASHKFIADSLLGVGGGFWPEFLSAPFRWFGASQTNQVAQLQATEAQLKSLFKKKANTQAFYIQLNTDLIESVQKDTELVLFPYNHTTSMVVVEELEKIELVDFPMVTTTKIEEIDEGHVIGLLGETGPKVLLQVDGLKKIIKDSSVLSAEQAIVLYQWYRNQYNQFQKAHKAYQEFMALILIELSHPESVACVLALHQLVEEKKQQFSDLYEQFAPYLQGHVPAHLDVVVQGMKDFFELESPSGTVSFARIQELELSLDSYFNDNDKIWAKSKEIYKKLAKHKLIQEDQNVFLIDESRALRLEELRLDKIGKFLVEEQRQAAKSRKRALKTIKYKQEEQNKVVDNSNALTTAHALVLSQWYQNKRNKFATARNAYVKFIEIVQSAGSHQNLAQGLKNLTAEQRKECQKLYNLFQPYYINGVPEKDKNAAVELDKCLVYFLRNPSLAPEISKKIKLLGELDVHFQVFFTDIDLRWKAKSRYYQSLAKEKHEEAHKRMRLTHENLPPRAHHLLPNEQISKAVHEMVVKLERLRTLFNKPMQMALGAVEKQVPASTSEASLANSQSSLVFTQKTKDNVPYPDVDGWDIVYTQSNQELVIKQLFNLLYYLKQTVIRLESIRDDSYKSIYVSNLIYAFWNIDLIKRHTIAITKDPHYSILGQELLAQVQSIWSLIMENVEGYVVGPEEVTDVPGNVEYNPLWYTLNAIYILPRHMRSLFKHKHLTAEELDELQVSAKKSQLCIEELIKTCISSDSNTEMFFRLFLRLPAMLGLHNDLIKKAKELLSTIHECTRQNLDGFHFNIFTPMLLEADRWEDAVGLKPGLISGPLRKIINEFFKGLLNSLNVDSGLYIALICDKAPIAARLLALQSMTDKNSLKIKQIDEDYQGIIKLHQELSGVYTSCSATQGHDALLALYKNNLPKITAISKEIGFVVEEPLTAQDIAYDAWFNQSLKEYDPHHRNIRGLLKSVHNYYLSQRNTCIMQEQGMKEKFFYLQAIEAQQDQFEKDFRLQYTTLRFDKLLGRLTTRHIGLQYADKEYNERLKEHLLNFKDDIIKKYFEEKGDIDKAIEQDLVTKIQKFERDNFQYYFQLDAIHLALAQFKSYFNVANLAIEQQAWTFENKSTLAEKSFEINALVSLADNKIMPITERLKKIKETVVGNKRFERIILQHNQNDASIVAKLKRWLLAFLELLHVYTPEKNTCFNRIKKEVSEPAKTSALIKRHGLFNKKPAIKRPEGIQDVQKDALVTL